MFVAKLTRPEQATATAMAHGDVCYPEVPVCGRPHCRFAIYTWHDSACFTCRLIGSSCSVV